MGEDVVNRFVFPIFVACLLAGCAGQLPWETKAGVDPAAEDDAKCQAAGYRPGTADYEKCRARVVDLRAQADAQSRTDLGARLAGKPPSWATQGPPQ
jgi:hypothetical protein